MKAVILFIFIVLSFPSFAATYTVDDDGPADFNAIQPAIDAADNNDTVIVHPGIYYEHVAIHNKSIILRSIDPCDPCVVAATIIDGNEIDRCINIDSFNDPNAAISGFTIRNGLAPHGAGISAFDSTGSVNNCKFVNNTADIEGGGLRSVRGTLLIQNCTFISNSASSGGCGFIIDGDTTFINCTFTANISTSAMGVGGLFLYYGTSTLDDCTFGRNSVGMLCRFCDDIILNNCSFTQNSKGGISADRNESLTLNNCTFTANSGWYIGGLVCDRTDTVLKNCLFIGNICIGDQKYPGNGGAVSFKDLDVIIKNCTFTQNSASHDGGAICGGSSDVRLVNSIVSGNTATNGDEIALSYSTIDVNYCDIKSGLSGIYNYMDLSTINWGIGNIDVDPCFVAPGYWDPNGTPTDANNDFFVVGDYHLKSAGWRWDSIRNRWDWDDVTSRCIDAGNPGCPLADEPMVIEDEIYGQNLRINMGAYGGTAQASIPPYDWALLTDTDNNGIVDLDDFAILAMFWYDTGSELFPDFNRDEFIDTNDLQSLTADWLSTTTWR